MRAMMTGGHRRPAARWNVFVRARATLDAHEHLAIGLGTSILAMVTVVLLVVTLLACLVGVGLLLVPMALRGLRAVANRERARLSRWGPEIIAPERTPAGLRGALADRTVRREAGWVVAHATSGLALGLVGLTFPVHAVQDATFWLWWWVLPPEEAATGALELWIVRDLPSALGVAVLAPIGIAVTMIVAPGMARLQAWPGRRLLAPDPDTDLTLRVAQLTATRAAALDAHATELRRIERSLHDGTQNRLVAVNVLLGAGLRALEGTPSAAREPLERAQGAAEQALAELRGVVRSILPPVLTDRSLADALTGLATSCPLPCRIDADIPARAAASVEATTYFVVAEALTNIAKHSQARQAAVKVRRHVDRLHVQIIDDGRGGADERRGSGLVGMRRRVEAHDGTFLLDSPPGGPTVLQVSLHCGS
ncbi:sensor domain-containing protein [Nonomuraea sp. K274]|uniref:histidine kinase n=1 Tax=Nonomuraea cypriaca TaxID=1187855 RepID=A0A931A9Y6_9ACTN|nr:sensor histidine kinase [Nonomuraea cypriaca]MBF8185507.1 sensor domain-containing protein [Nonomuraea cypriaca]